jgi:dimeric dUTPase (all-alpha-NTP-PPase superfamily)
VQEMLLHRIDLFAAYTQENFEAVFSSFFTLQKKLPVPGSERIIYYYQKIIINPDNLCLTN